MLRLPLIVAAMAMLAACTNSLESLQRTEASGSPFTRALADEYRQFAEYEAYEMYDWLDQQHFADKGLRAASGEVVLPEELADWNLPAHTVDELATARGNLITALDEGGRKNHPRAAAKAQAKFDCWVEQQEENHQPDHIAACKKEFQDAMAQLKQRMKAEPEPEPEPEPKPEPEPEMEPSNYLVFFDFDSATVNDGARAILDRAADKLPEYDDGHITIVGHADTSGPDDYNQALSERRANAVREALLSAGVSAGDMSTDAMGESEPLVETGDGVRSPQNRRVEITIE